MSSGSGSRPRSRRAAPADKEGELLIYRLEEGRKQWTNRWFKLVNKTLLYGQTRDALDRQCTVDGARAQVDGRRAYKFQFKVTLAAPNVKVGTIYLRASSADEMNAWINAINKAAGEPNPEVEVAVRSMERQPPSFKSLGKLAVTAQRLGSDKSLQKANSGISMSSYASGDGGDGATASTPQPMRPNMSQIVSGSLSPRGEGAVELLDEFGLEYTEIDDNNSANRRRNSSSKDRAGLPAVNRPKDTAFRQQDMHCQHIIMTSHFVIGLTLSIGIAFIGISFALASASAGAFELPVDYTTADPKTHNCTTDNVPNTCYASFTLEEDLLGKPVYLYYELDGMYQNHRRIIKSFSSAQLRGDLSGSYDSLVDCEPARSIGGSEDPEDFIVPCGLLPAAWFNDTYRLYDDNAAAVPVTKDGITWSTDPDKFNDPDPFIGKLNPKRPIRNMTDPDFINWMRPSLLPRFRKLHRIIPDGLASGDYTVEITNWYDVSRYDGVKRFVLATTSAVGSSHTFLITAFMVVGLSSLISGLIFVVLHNTHKATDV